MPKTLSNKTRVVLGNAWGGWGVFLGGWPPNFFSHMLQPA